MGSPTYVVDPNRVAAFWKALGYWSNGIPKVPKECRFSSYHFTTKNGPNGHALWTALDDLRVLPADLKDAIKLVGGSKLAKNMDLMELYLSTFGQWTEAGGKYFRKISWFPDKEDKVRVIAI